ncbi:MAG: glycosyltransferase family 2 protein, partial [Nevskiales bacterium]
LNHIGTLPGINTACLSHYVIARPADRLEPPDASVTVVIPCRNELGNVEAAVRRMPAFGAAQEILFVDGHSTDGTQDEIRRVADLYPDRTIRLLAQEGIGKGDAVRQAFEAATGEILMILDADLTVPPEDLPKFYRAIVCAQGEFISGCRLIYPMEDQAMQTLNLIANKCFALAFSWLLGQRLKDTLCGTKVLWRRDYQAIARNRAYFGDIDPFGDFDLLFGASKLNLKIAEIPVRYQNRTYGETKIHRFRHGWLLLQMVVYGYRKLKAV